MVVQSGSGNNITLASFQNSTNSTQNLSIIKQFDSLNIFKIGTTNSGIQIYENVNLGFFVGNFSTAKVAISSSGSVGIGSTGPTARLEVKGSGSTSATDSLLIQNFASLNSLQVRDDRVIIMSGMPTSAAGLPAGALWNNSGVINIV